MIHRARLIYILLAFQFILANSIQLEHSIIPKINCQDINNNGNDLISAFPKSLELLNRSVSLPISINMVDNFQLKIREALTSVFQS